MKVLAKILFIGSEIIAFDRSNLDSYNSLINETQITSKADTLTMFNKPCGIHMCNDLMWHVCEHGSLKTVIITTIPFNNKCNLDSKIQDTVFKFIENCIDNNYFLLNTKNLNGISEISDNNTDNNLKTLNNNTDNNKTDNNLKTRKWNLANCYKSVIFTLMDMFMNFINSDYYFCFMSLNRQSVKNIN